VPAEVVDSPGHGLQRLAECAAVRLVVGSFYLVGEARTSLATK
jgi:folylpolyglutamate synthase/dihydropteroate synthase